jgi:two-component system sensor kinase FixL
MRILVPLLSTLLALPVAQAQQASKPFERVLVADRDKSESRLSAASAPPLRSSLFEKPYRVYLVVAAGLAGLQTAVIIGLLWQRRRRRRIEQDLAHSERRLQLIANSLPALIAHVDKEERYTFANQACDDRFGLKRERMLGRTIREVSGEESYQKVRPYVARALSGERVSFSTTTIRDDGQRQSLDAIYVPDRDDRGSVQGFYALVLDVTERARARQESRRLLYELAHADRISMMGELAAALAHEVNQPLTAILSNAQAAQRFLNGHSHSLDLDEVREILGDIASDCARAGEVIRHVRTLVKKEESGFQSLDINQVVREVVGILRNDAMIHKVEIELSLQADRPGVNGDRIQLQQVIMNLLLNAFDAIEQGSPTDRTVQLESHCCDGEIQVTVRDHGPGIPRETFSRLFEPFNTSKPQGVGMGLSISRSIVGVHGGRLWARNNPDVGATFSFALPAEEVRTPAVVGVTHERAVWSGLRGR